MIYLCNAHVFVEYHDRVESNRLTITEIELYNTRYLKLNNFRVELDIFTTVYNKENSTAVFSIHFWDIFHWWNIMQMKFFHFGFVTYHFWSILTACNLMKIPWNYAKTVKIGSKKLATLTIGGLSFLNGNRSLQRFFEVKLTNYETILDGHIFK